MELQSISLWKGADIIIGTPGRIKEMVEKRHLSLERLSWVVID
jgi:superfamily II DNA/RNA helicase